MTLQGAARMGAAKAKSEVNDARLRTRIHELEAEVHQLNHEKLALQSCARASRGCAAARPHPSRPAEERMMRRAENRERRGSSSPPARPETSLSSAETRNPSPAAAASRCLRHRNIPRNSPMTCSALSRPQDGLFTENEAARTVSATMQP